MRQSNASRFINSNLDVNDGYAVICTAEALSRFMQCSSEEVFEGALNSEVARDYLIRVMRNLQNQSTN
jgi:hypothetical protein